MGRQTTWTPASVRRAVELGLEGLGPAAVARRLGVPPGRVSALFSRLRAEDEPAPAPARAPRGRKPSPWDAPPERRERVLDLVAQGVTFAVIAEQLGTTKSAIAGLVGRARAQGEARAHIKDVRAELAAAERGEAVPGLVERLRWDVVMAGGCRWIYGHPRPDPGEVADWHWCGAPRVTGLSYCPAHALAAYQRTPRETPPETGV
jgi:hypothetical protein